MMEASELTLEQAESLNSSSSSSNDRTDALDHDPDPSNTHKQSNKVLLMLDACSKHNQPVMESLIAENALYVSQQDLETGKSPLMAAAEAGHLQACQFLLDNGAPWNAIDRRGQCAGNYATDNQHWECVNLLVDAGTRAELVLGASIRLQREAGIANEAEQQQQDRRPVEHEPCTKPDYLRQRLSYNENGTALLDQDRDAVMMEWERPLMEAHASVLMQDASDTATSCNTTTMTTNNRCNRSVLNVGFGMGIIDSCLQKFNPSMHIIIEAHPDVYKQMMDDKWHEKPNVRICFGKWQDVMPKLIDEGVQVDAIFYDTYGEHFMDLEDFHQTMTKVLSKPHGIYSFFNGLAPDNLFFHGVACQCVKLQLGRLGLDAEFLPCEIQVRDSEWEGIRRKYWHGRDTYYLPRVAWKPNSTRTSLVVAATATSTASTDDSKMAADDLLVETSSSDKKANAACSLKDECKEAKRQKI